MITSQLVGQPLTENDLYVLMEELNNIRSKWYEIGLQLEVSVGTLNAIKKDYHTTSDCLRETLTTWLKTFSSPAWSTMVDVLKSRTVGEVNLAVELEQKYCLTQDTSIAAIHRAPPPPPLPPSQALTWVTPPTQYTIPPTVPPVLVYTLTPPSHPPPGPYYYLLHTNYPMSTPLPLIPPSGVATTSVHPFYSQVPQVSSRPLLSSHVQPITPQFPTTCPPYPSPSSLTTVPPGTSPIPPLATVTTPPDLTLTHTFGMIVLYSVL